ncbi:MAG: M48 family metalloprotease [Phycisphaerae bacterium]|nr:M48 family metalloprotease [Phycisphaerae bacterium]
MQLLVVAAFVLIFLREESGWPARSLAHPWWVPALFPACMALVWLAADRYMRAQGVRIDRTGDHRAVRRAFAAGRVARGVGLALHAGAVLGLDWLGAVRAVVGDLVAVDEVLAATPMLVLIVLTWWSEFPIDRRLREAGVLANLERDPSAVTLPARRQYLLSAIRNTMGLTLVPIVAITGWEELAERVAGRLAVDHHAALLGARLVGVALVLLLMPAAAVRLWDTVPLGAGPLRDRLLDLAALARVRVRNLLVWRTHMATINGAVMGLVAPLRYVLLTDALLGSLPLEQVRAVMAHELGHVRHRHLPWLLAGGLSILILSGYAAERAVAALPGIRGDATDLAALVLSLALAFWAFGAISRRFERQADTFAARLLSEAEGHAEVRPEAVVAMAGALETVALLNHIPADRHSWRHGSIRSRQASLMALSGRAADDLGPDRSAGRAKAAIALGCAAALTIVAFGGA